MEAAQAALRAVEQRRDALLREAKAALGLWSGEGGRRREVVAPGLRRDSFHDWCGLHAQQHVPPLRMLRSAQHLLSRAFLCGRAAAQRLGLKKVGSSSRTLLPPASCLHRQAMAAGCQGTGGIKVPPLWKEHTFICRRWSGPCSAASTSTTLLPSSHCLFSPISLQRQSFWDAFSATLPPTPFVCPVPASLPLQRQSFWDAFFIIMSRREGDWLGLLLRLLLQARCAAQLLSADHTAVLGSRLVALGSMQEHAPAA